GPATNIIAGFAVALECTALPTFTISAAIIASYKLGASSGLAHAGLFGTAVATMGMLGTAAYILAMDTFGPITDNAGGIIEMSHQPEDIRKRTDRLDAVGNTTKALTKGYAIGSAALAAFLLFSAYLDEVAALGSPPVPGRPRDLEGHVAAGLRASGGHRDGRGAQGHGGSRAARRRHADRRRPGLQGAVPCRRRDRSVVPDGGHDRRDSHGDAAQQRRWCLGQRQEVHRDGRVRREGQSDPQGGGGRRHRRGPVERHGGAGGAPCHQAVEHGHAGAGAALCLAHSSSVARPSTNASPTARSEADSSARSVPSSSPRSASARSSGPGSSPPSGPRSRGIPDTWAPAQRSWCPVSCPGGPAHAR